MKQMLTTLMLLLTLAGTAMAQRTVGGIVSGDDGETLVGATVAVKGTSVGTRTDINGKYSVQVPAGSSVLVFSYTGYQTQELEIGSSNAVDVVLASGQVLQEAVVTALGITRSEKALGYTVSQVDGAKVVSSGEVNVIQGLAAKLSGVQVVGSGGTPGASSKILIRGNSTFQLNNEPLIVIDNIPYDNQVNTVVGGDYPFNANLQGVNESNRALDINPDDIENISVLKGPAASALYGTRAANGVVMITTKKGAKGRLKVNYSMSYSMDEVNKLPELQSEYGYGSGGGALLPDGSGSKAEGTPTIVHPNSWGERIPAGEVFDNYDLFFQRGTSLNNNISLSGGNDLTTFRFGYGNSKQTGVVPNTELNRNTFRLSTTSGIDKFKISLNATYTALTDIKAQNGSNLSGAMLALTRMPADFNVLGGSGENGYENRDGSQHTYFGAYDNPIWSAYNNPNETNLGRFTGSIGADYLPLDWLTLTFRIATDFYNDRRTQIWDISSQNFDPSGEYWINNARHEEVNTDFLAHINKRFGLFSTSVTLGSQINQRVDQNVFSRGTGFAVGELFNMSNAANLYSDNTDLTRRVAGVFASVDLGYKELVYLTVAGRNDWASTFGPKAKSSFFYPSTSLSFVPTELLASNDVLTYLKLRASYAQAGREPAIYSSATYFGRPTFTDGFTNGIGFPYLGQNGFVSGLGSPNVLGNSQLRPEINTSYEFGFDARLWRNRVRAAFTYYRSKSTDLLVNLPIASTSGYQNYTSNIGEMENKGIELELNVDLFRSRGFNWTLGGNFTKNINEVLALAPGVSQFNIETAFNGIGPFAIVGQPYGAIFGTTWQRNAQGQLIIGANGLPLVNNSSSFLGNPYPDWISAIRNTFSYKGLSLMGLLDIREGGALWNGTYARLNRIGRTQESADGRDKAYLIEGVKADGTPNTTKVSAFDYFRTFKGDGGAFAYENAIQDGSWVRLRELTLTYDFPKLTKAIEGLSVYVTGRNLWLDTEYKGVDPETSLTGSGSNTGGFDYFNMPSTKSYIVGLRANF
jgi:TonB-linked SusC/RagA family outer membrane protein